MAHDELPHKVRGRQNELVAGFANRLDAENYASVKGPGFTLHSPRRDRLHIREPAKA